MKLQANRILGLSLAALLVAVPQFAPAASQKTLTIIVVIIDSLGPGDLAGEPPVMPHLQTLGEAGVRVERSQGVFPPETLPNHAAILTGRYPENNGIAAATYWDRIKGHPESPLSRPAELNAPTLFKRVKAACTGLKTAAVISSRSTRDLVSECGPEEAYCGLNSIEPDTFFDPAAQASFQTDTQRTTDVVTIGYARNYLNHADLLVMNLGDADRATRLDLASPFSRSLAREAALADTDQRIGQLVADLKKVGRWESTVMFVVSDRGVGPTRDQMVVPLAGVLSGLGKERFVSVIRPNRASVYFRDRDDPDAWIAAREMAEALTHQIGVGEVHFTSLHNALTAGMSDAQINALLLPAGLRARHENLGELVVHAADGYRFGTSAAGAGPAGSIHTYPSTQDNTLMILGGIDFLARGKLIEQAGSVDLAPTIAWLLGVPLEDRNSLEDEDGSLKRDAKGQRIMQTRPHYDGRPLTEAFTLQQAPAKGSCGILP